jgi:hypothetical protein
MPEGNIMIDIAITIDWEGGPKTSMVSKSTKTLVHHTRIVQAEVLTWKLWN